MITKQIGTQLTGMVVSMLIVAGALAAGSLAVGAAEPKVHVAKTATCGCCKIWIDYMKKEGFDVVTQTMAAGQLAKYKMEQGIEPEYASCHTAKVGGYVVEGHVPVREIKRLLDEKPDAIGLAVPGMPLGSPGMDFGSEKEPYEVLLIKKDGSVEVFGRYGNAG